MYEKRTDSQQHLRCRSSFLYTGNLNPKSAAEDAHLISHQHLIRRLQSLGSKMDEIGPWIFVLSVVVVLTAKSVGLVCPIHTDNPIGDDEEQIEHNAVFNEQVEERDAKTQVGQTLLIGTNIDRFPLDHIVAAFADRLVSYFMHGPSCANGLGVEFGLVPVGEQ